MDRKDSSKMVILVIVSIGAVISLFYGISTPSKFKRQAPSGFGLPQQQPRLGEKVGIQTQRLAKRTAFGSWGRNPFSLQTVRSKIAITELTLNGVVWDEMSPKAIINGTIVGIGNRIAGNTVVEIRQDRVILNDGVRNFELRLGE